MAVSSFSAVVLTLNEIRNIEECLRSLQQITPDILVVDSGSTDGTVERARELGARVIFHEFTTHADQWKFALHEPLRGEWVIALDADQRVTPELAASLRVVASRAGPETEGIYVNRLHVFRGQPMRHGGLYPKWMLKVFRKGTAFTDPRELLDFRFYVRGETVRAQGELIEDNRNEAEISFWIDKHNRFATRQANEEIDRWERRDAWVIPPKFFGTPDQRILWLKSRWYRMPRYSRPFLYFAWRYFVRLGFLDGKQGFIFHVLQAFWYRLLVDIKIDDLVTAKRNQADSNV